MNKVVKLYNDSITLHFADNARNRYTIEETGSSPVGVTTVLQTLNKPALMTWPMNEAIAHLKINLGDYEGAAKAYLKKSDKGKDTGTEIHALIEQDLLEMQNLSNFKPTLVGASTDAVKAFRSWSLWRMDQVSLKPLAVEEIIYSKKFDYAGTYDCLLEIDGEVVLCDLKTNNASQTAPLGVYPEHFLQLGAYSLAHLEENPLEEIDDLMIIRVGKDGVLNTLRSSELGLSIKQCQNAFIATLHAYKFLTPLSKQIREKK